MNDIVLEGCRPTPLAHYLKALGVLRLVSEQKDPEARGHWDRDRFVLRTSLNREELVRFFLEEYQPTPLVTPWNGGSGFYAKDNDEALSEIRESTSKRLRPYRDTIEQGFKVLSELGIVEKVKSGDKQTVLESCRAQFSDEALQWLDAAFILSGDGAKYPPLLGTGGNDGRLEFTNNFMQHLTSLMEPLDGVPSHPAQSLLHASLFGELSAELTKAAIGQFLPEHAGGANASSGFSASSLINSWDFVLMLEGACVFTAACVKRMPSDAEGELSSPFTVRAVGAGYGSAAAADEEGSNSRGELWLPLWQRSSSAKEILSLFSEGRVRVSARPARNGVDFARAITNLGVDRGLSGFERFGFHVRNGLSYFAVPLGRFRVRAEPRVSLLGQIDEWLDRFRREAGGKKAPARAQGASLGLETKILQLCAQGDALRTQQVLIALGQCERTMVSSLRWATESFLKPIPALDPKWLREADDGSVEYRLAASLASVRASYRDESRTRLIPIKEQFEPVRTWKNDDGSSIAWNPEAGREVAWTDGPLVVGLNAVLARRLLFVPQAGAGGYQDKGFPSAALGDVCDFIEGRVDDQRLTSLIHGMLLIDWSRVTSEHLPSRRPLSRRPMPGAFYSTLKLCFPGRPDASPADSAADGEPTQIPVVRRIQRLASSGQGAAAFQEARRRLRGSGVSIALTDCITANEIASRASAALLFPISARDLHQLRLALLRPQDITVDEESNATPSPNQELAT